MSEEFWPKQIVLGRHGQSVWNEWGREKKKQGLPPPRMEGVPDHRTPLTNLGIKQSIKTGIALGEEFEKFDFIYHSPYLRTTETAHLIADNLGYDVPVIRDPLLVEQQFGWLDAGIYADKEEFLDMQKRFEEIKRSSGKFYAKPPNGESWHDVTLRTHQFLIKLFRSRFEGKNICLVSHSVTNATFYYHLMDKDEDEVVEFYQNNNLGNCSVIHFLHNINSSSKWELNLWNKCYWK